MYWLDRKRSKHSLPAYCCSTIFFSSELLMAEQTWCLAFDCSDVWWLLNSPSFYAFNLNLCRMFQTTKCAVFLHILNRFVHPLVLLRLQCQIKNVELFSICLWHVAIKKTFLQCVCSVGFKALCMIRGGYSTLMQTHLLYDSSQRLERDWGEAKKPLSEWNRFLLKERCMKNISARWKCCGRKPFAIIWQSQELTKYDLLLQWKWKLMKLRQY